MKYIPADKLIAEIERLGRNWDGVQELQPASLFQADLYELLSIITSLQQEQPELPPIGYAETYYQRGLHDGIIKGRINILRGLEDTEKRKAKPVLVIKEQDQPEVDLEKDIDAFFDKWDKNSYGCIFDENGTPVTIKTIKGVVKHFINARKEE